MEQKAGRMSVEPMKERIGSCNCCGRDNYDRKTVGIVNVLDFAEWRTLRIGRGNMDTIMHFCPQCIERLSDLLACNTRVAI